jgi:hypothetical protein
MYFQLVARSPSIQLMESPITSGQWEYVLARMFAKDLIAPKPLKVNCVDELRNDQTGRLDAKRVSEVFGLPVSTIAAWTNFSVQTLKSVAGKNGFSQYMSKHRFT